MPKKASGADAFDDSLDFKFIDPTNYEDADDAGVSAARKQQLLNDAINVAVQSWVVAKAAENDQARADAMVIPDPPAPVDPVVAGAEEDAESDPVTPEDPYEDERRIKEALIAGAEAQQATADSLDKSFRRKKARLTAAGVTVSPSMVKDAKKAFLVGQADAQGNRTGGYLQRLEGEFMQHKQRRARALKAMALTGALALNEQEMAEMQQQIDESEAAMETLRSVIQLHRQELINLGGALPAKAGEGAPVNGSASNRQARRSAARKAGKPALHSVED